MPHPLLIPKKNPGYQRIRDAYESVRKEIERLKPDLVLLYSTKWLSVIGHQVQTRKEPEWTHVDEEWHELGSIPYKFRMDPAFGEKYVELGRARGLEMRTVDYHGFPIDTGSVVALKLINPENKVPASIVSCNMYADRAETIILGKAARDAVEAAGKRTVAVAITNLSNRVFHNIIPYEKDHIHSHTDDEWNRKYLEFFERGRLEDASQLARQFSGQAHGDSRMKAVWWLAALMGQTNNFEGKLFAYEPVYGTGCAVVGLFPTLRPKAGLEFDEDSADVYGGDRNVLATDESAKSFDADQPGAELLQKHFAEMRQRRAQEEGSGATQRLPAPVIEKKLEAGKPDARIVMVRPDYDQPKGKQPDKDKGVIVAKNAPKPVGAYAHARRVGDLLFLAGLGPRDPATDSIPGGPIHDKEGKPLTYDIEAQTEAVVRNLKTVLEASGASLDDVVDVTVYLTDMKRDFPGFNKVYKKHFETIQATRTTVEVEALPTPIAVEFKAIASLRGKS